MTRRTRDDEIEMAQVLHTLILPKSHIIEFRWCCSRGLLSRVTILAKWLCHFNDLAVGETAAPACFLRENAEGAGMPPLLSH